MTSKNKTAEVEADVVSRCWCQHTSQTSTMAVRVSTKSDFRETKLRAVNRSVKYWRATVLNLLHRLLPIRSRSPIQIGNKKHRKICAEIRSKSAARLMLWLTSSAQNFISKSATSKKVKRETTEFVCFCGEVRTTVDIASRPEKKLLEK